MISLYLTSIRKPRKMKNILRLSIILLLSINLYSCQNRTQEESAKESLKGAENAIEAARNELQEAEDRIEGATDVLEQEKVYCCTNHEPPHCGTALEMENLINTKGCSGFEAQGIAAGQ